MDRGRGHAYGSTRGPTSRRSSDYKKTQDLYTKNKKSLADVILEGRSLNSPSFSPPSPETVIFFKAIFESPSAADEEPTSSTKMLTNTIGHPITVEEIVAASKCCTVLIPKGGDLQDPTNWRPITVGSAWQRLLHRIVSSRIVKATNLNRNQRGFTSGDGVLANCFLLDTYIHNKRKKVRPYNVVSLDIAKAFDTVSHHSIRRALQRHGISEILTNYSMKDQQRT